MSAYIPEDLVLEILPGLPLKCLIRFRSVSKSWATLIGTPDYLSKSLINDCILANPTHQLLFVKRSPESTDARLSYSFLCYSTLASASDSETHQDLPLQSPYDIKIVGSCNGLLCLFDYYGTSNIVVWNPTTVEFMFLPHAWDVETVCFGFDPIHEEFKVLRIRYVLESDEPYYLPPYLAGRVHLNQEVEVYSLSGGSWRNLAVDVEVPKFQGVDSSYKNGVCFWLALSYYGDEKIVAFDVCDEVIQTMALPNYSLEYGEITWRTLTVLKESVALIVYPRNNGEDRFFDIWLLLEFGVKESWIRLVRIVPICGFGWPLGFWKRGELFIVCRDQGELVLYDPFTQTVRTLQLDGEWFHVLPFTPSSVGINGSGFLDG
ncbi:F-box protein At3g07870-like [Juglans microcarpa x Juglans regia]|uniref:F-box protein At3g07870-like n=1 Tax=Juglans microcarpa x Juglans regia TaxID=2249226 RepID=UPI001B7F0F5B|nr:F-box protein At3g07870-like [Juglans microcarpa x Juglans regia]